MRKTLQFSALICYALALSGCSHLEQWLRQAARDKGTAEARVTLPEYPEDCRRQEPHAPLIIGTEIRSILKRERTQLDKANAKTERCAGFYQDLKERIQ